MADFICSPKRLFGRVWKPTSITEGSFPSHRAHGEVKWTWCSGLDVVIHHQFRILGPWLEADRAYGTLDPEPGIKKPGKYARPFRSLRAPCLPCISFGPSVYRLCLSVCLPALHFCLYVCVCVCVSHSVDIKMCVCVSHIACMRKLVIMSFQVANILIYFSFEYSFFSHGNMQMHCSTHAFRALWGLAWSWLKSWFKSCLINWFVVVLTPQRFTLGVRQYYKVMESMLKSASIYYYCGDFSWGSHGPLLVRLLVYVQPFLLI
jgi:hypothetical protein